MQTTIHLDSQTHPILEVLLRDLPEPAEPTPGYVDIANLLFHLANRWPEPPGENEYQDLHMLCRQIAVPKKVLQVYRLDDRKTTQGELLAGEYWPLLIAVLLAYAEQVSEYDPQACGFTYKCLNAALQALDLAEGIEDRVPLAASPPVSHLASLRTWANGIIENIDCENVT